MEGTVSVLTDKRLCPSASLASAAVLAFSAGCRVVWLTLESWFRSSTCLDAQTWSRA